ncbi:VWA domain-containing protein [Agrobacterium sp. NPDC058088]|uniref:vWA domain-containing protein n=1 Tax=Agrobacterium sp. NPDC058088 TaxID=3346335 RepID=UPI0036DE6CEF
MMGVDQLPVPITHFVRFTGILRNNGFPVSPEQTMGFIKAIGLLGPNRIDDIHQAAIAMLAPPIERRGEFDALFRNHFQGQVIEAAASEADDDEEIRVQDAREGSMEPPQADEVNTVGGEATSAETLTLRVFADMNEAEAVRAFARMAGERLPRRRSRRMMAGRGEGFDLRRSLRQAVRFDGELLRLSETRRRTTLRRIVLFLDVSGSMKEQTEAMLRFAHALVRVGSAAGAGVVEVFTIGTRLTRITPALKARNRTVALDGASALVADWDGGTRLGDAMAAFMAVPRFAGFARGASVVVISDGLELGETDTLERAVRRMSQLAWRLDWLTPLAADSAFEPRTAALQAIIPSLTSLGDGSRIQVVCEHVLSMARKSHFNPQQGSNPRQQWRKNIYGTGNSSARFR